MRYFFWFLVLLNLGLLAYFSLDYVLPNKTQNIQKEINPEKIKIIPPNEMHSMKEHMLSVQSPVITEDTDVAQTACYEWGIFSDNNLTSAQAALAALSIPYTIKAQSSQEAKRFWVYSPPFRSASEAQKKAAELKSIGVEDLFVVQEARWKNAISFGIFSDEKLAIHLQKELQAKGVKNVEKALRTQGKTYSSLTLNNLTENNIIEIKKLKPSFPAADLKTASCN